MEKELQKRILSSILIIPLVLFFIIKGSIFFIFFLLILFLIALLEWIKIVKKIELKILGIIFLSFSFYLTFLVRDIDLLNFLFIFIVCISTDIGGYFFGKTFKGPKLTKISPNKTYSGVVGGFLLSIITSYIIFKIYYPNFLDFTLNNDLIFLFMVFLISFVSQIGDLIISYFKRLSKIKNTGKIFPGHGGLLDRIDGMIFAFPIFFIIHKVLI